jgi:hypothetical protein
LFIPDPGSKRFPDLESGSASASKNLSIKMLFLSSRIYNPTCSSLIQIPDPNLDYLPVANPGSRCQKGTESRIQIRNTGCINDKKMGKLEAMDLLACRLPQLQAAMYWTPLVCCIAGRIFLPGTRSSSGSSCTSQQVLYTVRRTVLWIRRA